MLPTNPRPGRRSASATRPPTGSHSRPSSQPRTTYYQDDSGYSRGRAEDRSSARQVRPQRSVGSLSSGHARDYGTPPPMPPLPRQRQQAGPSRAQPPRSVASVNRVSDSSSSSSSSGSSFLNRMRQRHPDAASSQSSFELEREDDYDVKGRRGNVGPTSRRLHEEGTYSISL